MTRIPFQLPDVGLREFAGTVWLEDDFLVIRIQDALIGEFDKEKTVIQIEPQALSDVRFERGFMKDRLVLEPRGPKLLESMPGKHEDVVVLRVWRYHRRDTKLLAVTLRQAIRSA